AGVISSINRWWAAAAWRRSASRRWSSARTATARTASARRSASAPITTRAASSLISFFGTGQIHQDVQQLSRVVADGDAFAATAPARDLKRRHTARVLAQDKDSVFAGHP